MTDPQRLVLVDTNIWHWAYIRPTELEFVPIHERASDFLSDLLTDETFGLALTTYQICEILDLFRKSGMRTEERKEFMGDFFSGDFYVKEITIPEVRTCLCKSIDSGIHVYDYLVALPLKGTVVTFYSADDHFQHKDFTEIAVVENPLDPWILREGRRPMGKKGVKK